MKKSSLKIVRKQLKRIVPLLLAVSMLTSNVAMAATAGGEAPAETTETVEVLEVEEGSYDTDFDAADTESEVESSDIVEEDGKELSDEEDTPDTELSEPESEEATVDETADESDAVNEDEEHQDIGQEQTGDEDQTAEHESDISADDETHEESEPASEVNDSTGDQELTEIDEVSDEEISVFDEVEETAIDAEITDLEPANLQAGELTVTLDANGGYFPTEDDKEIVEIPIDQEIYSLDEYSLPVPEKDDGLFSAWYMDPECTEEADLYMSRTEGVTLYAGWKDSVTVTFVTFNGLLHDYETGQESDMIVKQYLKDDYIGNHSIPWLIGPYWDQGWYRNKEFTVSYDPWNEPLTDNITVYLKTEHYYTVTLHANGGYYINGEGRVDALQMNFGEGSYLTKDSLIAPLSDSAAFDSWYMDAACMEPMEQGIDLDHDVEFYAAWTEDYITVTFKTTRGSLWDYELQTEGKEIEKKFRCNISFSEISKPDAQSSEETGYLIISGWYRDEALTDQIYDEDILTEDMDIWARTIKDVEVTLHANGGAFLRDGESSDAYQFTCYSWNSIRDSSFPTPQKEGVAFDAWYFDPECTQPADLEVHPYDDTELYAGYTDDVIRITFILKGGMLRDEDTGEEAESITKTVKKGIIFDEIRKPFAVGKFDPRGWYLDEAASYDPVNWDRHMQNDTTVYLDAVPVFDVIFHANGGYFMNCDDPTQRQIPADGYIPDFIEVPSTSEDIAFDGWYYDAACTDPVKKTDRPEGDIDIYAGWTADYVTIHFVTDTDELYDPVSAVSGTEVDRKIRRGSSLDENRNLPYPNGDYRLLGWYTDRTLKDRWDDSAAIKEDITLYADILGHITVTLHANGGVFSDNEDTRAVFWSSYEWYETLKDLGINGIVPFRDDAVFDGWYYDAACTEAVDLQSRPRTDIDLYAGWTKDIVTVTFAGVGGRLYDPETGEENAEIVRKYKKGDTAGSRSLPYGAGEYNVSGWYSDENFRQYYDVYQELTEDITIYVKLSRSVTVEFNANGGFFKATGDEVDYMSAQEGRKYRDYGWETPIHEEAVFDGWYMDKEGTKPLDYNAVIKDGDVIYAKWTHDTVRVTYKAEHGMLYNYETGSYDGLETSVVYKRGEKLQSRSLPKFYANGSGYLFRGWYTDSVFETRLDESMTLTGDITVYAGLDKAYRVTLDANGGRFNTGEEIHSYTYELRENQQIVPSLTPLRSGYAFDTWYYDAACTKPYTIGRLISEDVRLYAGWTSDTVTVTFDPMGKPIEDTELDKRGTGITINKEYKRGEPLSTRKLPQVYREDGEYWDVTGHFVWYKDPGFKTQMSQEDELTEDVTLYGRIEYSVSDLRRMLYISPDEWMTLFPGDTVELSIGGLEDLPEEYKIEKVEWLYDTKAVELETTSESTCQVKVLDFRGSRVRARITVRLVDGGRTTFIKFTRINVNSPNGTPYKMVFKPNYAGGPDDYIIDAEVGDDTLLPYAEDIGFERDGYSFVGWSQQSGTAYTDIENIIYPEYRDEEVKAADEVKTYYAVWGPKDYKPLIDWYPDPQWVEVERGKTQKIDIWLEPEDADLQGEFMFISDDPSVASVDKTGLIIAKTSGYTYIRILYMPTYDEEDRTWYGVQEWEVEVDVLLPSDGQWVRENGNWRYYEDGAAVKSDWRNRNDGQSFLDENGNMVTSELIDYDDDLYYADSDGWMVQNTWVVFDTDTGAENWYFFDNNGKAVKGRIYAVSGVEYQFNENGVWLDENKLTATVKNSSSDGVVTWKSDDADSSTVYFIYRKNIPVGKTEGDAVIEKAAEVTGTTSWTDSSFSNKKGSIQYLVKYTDDMPSEEEFGGSNATNKLNVLFTDVTRSGDYYFNPVYWAAENGITNGYTSGQYKGKFGVGLDCQRRELLIFLWRYAGQPTGYGDARKMFNDLGSYAPSSATNQAIAWACTEGITKGYSDGGFHPTAPIVRKDVMILLYRLAGKPAVSGTLSFPDCKNYNKSSDTYKAILWGSQKGITKGYNSGPYKGKFGVGLNCLREQIVTFLYRYDTN